MKKTPAQKIRDYFKTPKWERLTKKTRGLRKAGLGPSGKY